MWDSKAASDYTSVEHHKWCMWLCWSQDPSCIVWLFVQTRIFTWFREYEPDYGAEGEDLLLLTDRCRKEKEPRTSHMRGPCTGTANAYLWQSTHREVKHAGQLRIASDVRPPLCFLAQSSLAMSAPSSKNSGGSVMRFSGKGQKKWHTIVIQDKTKNFSLQKS